MQRRCAGGTAGVQTTSNRAELLYPWGLGSALLAASVEELLAAGALEAGDLSFVCLSQGPFWEGTHCILSSGPGRLSVSGPRAWNEASTQ